MTESINPPITDLARGHTVSRYDQELAKLRGIILEMGEHVVEQIQAAVSALVSREENLAFRVLDREPQVDFLALDADEEVFRVIARRQPTAIDLRIVLALSKIAGDVERAGDKAARIARQSIELDALGGGEDLLSPRLRAALSTLDACACCMFERGISGVARFDVRIALDIFEREPALYEASHAVRALLSDAEQEGLSARQTVCVLTSAHALERIGNHAANIAEQVIYVAEGQDVRFRNREILIETLRHRTL
ncbi:phosphate signaling complex protein PhoU [Marichromatium bheemlicum]|uniref:Phosphate-specific transport system accessory protein PhoU n=1 Tax=Marichromatium bheemlicum TaxID=365339 RepID=A0ABX1I597_9GAMM|nr:phosphate signaling complex protein PhoU [Marichromatium bheemlicum]NKN32104.1 phosphate signaling complex protein PhoU [Marichromatium bheemlicum]